MSTNHLTRPGGAVAHCGQVLENTLGLAVSRPVSAALSRPKFLQGFMGRMGLPVRMAAWLDPGFQHPPTRCRLKTARRVFLSSSSRSLKP